MHRVKQLHGTKCLHATNKYLVLAKGKNYAWLMLCKNKEDLLIKAMQAQIKMSFKRSTH